MTAVSARGSGPSAARIRRGRFPPWRQNRGEWLETMCLAAVFGESGQSRVPLYAALTRAMATGEYRKQITSALDDIQAMIARYGPYADVGQARHRLFALRAALNVDDDLRIRVERADMDPGRANGARTLDRRCTDEAHRRDALAEVLRQRESVVMVCPRPGGAAGCASLALDFHKVAQVTGRAPVGERFRLTESAKRLHRAKYERSAAEISLIAGELAGIVDSHPAYRKAEMIAVVSGRKHDCSTRLGTEVAGLAGKTRVTLARKNECDAALKFMLIDLDSVEDRNIVLVDDVYRTGDTFRNAVHVLRRAGARQIFGLTVTCTVSALSP